MRAQKLNIPHVDHMLQATCSHQIWTKLLLVVWCLCGAESSGITSTSKTQCPPRLIFVYGFWYGVPIVFYHSPHTHTITANLIKITSISSPKNCAKLTCWVLKYRERKKMYERMLDISLSLCVLKWMETRDKICMRFKSHSDELISDNFVTKCCEWFDFHWNKPNISSK